MFSASDVKKLREITNAGMMDCKKALDQTNGDMDKAIEWLRENGIAKAAKKESRIAAEGLTEAAINDNDAIIFEVNCETDFVTKNDKFVSLIEELRKALLFSDCTDYESALNVKLEDGKTVSERIVEKTATIGEKISFRRFERITKSDDEVFGAYSHMGGKITSLVVLKGDNKDVARDIAMHNAAMHPLYVKPSDVPTEVLEHEKEIMRTELLNEGKQADKVEMILGGKVNKYYEEVCLENQVFIKAENKETVKKYAEANGCEVVSAIRYEVGEGIEKKQENFAEEVMSQING